MCARHNLNKDELLSVKGLVLGIAPLSFPHVLEISEESLVVFSQPSVPLSTKSIGSHFPK